MKPAEQLAQFVGKAIEQGVTRTVIVAELQKAGWLDSEIDRAMAAWADTGFVPPVPRPRIAVSARDAFGYGVLFTALAFSVYHLNSLGFELINRWFASALEDAYQSGFSLQSMRWSIATLVVSVPLFIWLNRRLALAMRADPAQRRSALRRWFGYVTLFLALMGLAGDAVATIYAFLNGDLTLQFALKAGLVLLTVGLVFLYYRLDTEASDAA